jgi:branched-chain amino acid transport system permease protein
VLNPLPFIVSGLVSGSVYGLTAMGLVFTYKVSRVVNFAFGAIAMFCAYVYWQVTDVWSVPMLLGIAIAIVALPAGLALASESVVYRHLRGASVFARTAASIGILLALYGLTQYLWNTEITQGTLTPHSVFSQSVYSWPGVNVSMTQIGTVVVVFATVAVVSVILKFSNWGVSLRAVVVNEGLAQLRGINTQWATRLAWIVSYVLAAIGGLLIAPLSPPGDPLAITLIVVYSLAAATLGGLESLPLAFIGGLALGLGDSMLLAYGPAGLMNQYVRGALPFVFMLVALILNARRLSTSHDAESKDAILADLGVVTRRRTASLRPILTRVVLAAIVGLFLVSQNLGHDMILVSSGVAVAIIFLSYRVFTATTGMVSLAQAAFAGVGAFTVANLTVSGGWPWPLAIAAAAVITGLGGAIVALPTVRLRGIFLALATLAFALLIERVVFVQAGFTGGTNGKLIPRPSWFTSDLGYLMLLLFAFLAIGYLCERFEFSRIGRELQADLSSGAGAYSIGIRPGFGRLMAFMLASAVAGVGGAFLAAQTQFVSSENWGILIAFVWLVFVASAGVGSTGMMLEIGILTAIAPEIVQSLFPSIYPGYVALVGVLGLVLLRVPGGLASMRARQGQALRRLAAKRKTTTPRKGDTTRLAASVDEPA